MNRFHDYDHPQCTSISNPWLQKPNWLVSLMFRDWWPSHKIRIKVGPFPRMIVINILLRSCGSYHRLVSGPSTRWRSDVCWEQWRLWRRGRLLPQRHLWVFDSAKFGGPSWMSYWTARTSISLLIPSLHSVCGIEWYKVDPSTDRCLN
jgi:hypothetical protein